MNIKPQEERRKKWNKLRIHARALSLRQGKRVPAHIKEIKSNLTGIYDVHFSFGEKKKLESVIEDGT